jgi:SPP1 gp7 family putative phage head morphogenesis protein
MPRLLHDAAIPHKLGDLFARHLAAANILGRTQIVREVHRKTGKVVPISTASRKPTHHFAELDTDAEPDLLKLGFSVNLPPDRAAEYLRELTPVTRHTFDGLTAQYRRDAFTIAGTADLRLIQKIRDQLAKTLHQGATPAEFKAAAKALTTEAGVEELNAFTLDTVFQTNMQKAYSLGRYEQMSEPAVTDALPFWEYMTVGDDRVRPEHAVLDGFQALAADPVWNKIYPPNGFNCRCTVIPLLADEAGKNAGDDGTMRLPALAVALVPQEGFGKVFGARFAA